MSRLDPVQIAALLVEGEHGDALKPHSLLAAVARVDDRLAVRAALADPETRFLLTEFALAEDLDLVAFRSFLQMRSHRIVDKGREQPEQKCDDHRRCGEFPGRHAGGARHHELVSPRQVEIAGHRADQRAERHDALRDDRHAEERQLQITENAVALSFAGCAAHQFDQSSRATRNTTPQKTASTVTRNRIPK